MASDVSGAASAAVVETEAWNCSGHIATLSEAQKWTPLPAGTPTRAAVLASERTYIPTDLPAYYMTCRDAA